jgi:hypothetical protein
MEEIEITFKPKLVSKQFSSSKVFQSKRNGGNEAP